MSKGTKIITLRLPPGIEEDMDIQIEQRNEWTKDAPWNRTAFILAAIREKLAHMQRSRRKKGRGAKA